MRNWDGWSITNSELICTSVFSRLKVEVSKLAHDMVCCRRVRIPSGIGKIGRGTVMGWDRSYWDVCLVESVHACKGCMSYFVAYLTYRSWVSLRGKMSRGGIPVKPLVEEDPWPRLLWWAPRPLLKLLRPRKPRACVNEVPRAMKLASGEKIAALDAWCCSLVALASCARRCPNNVSVDKTS